MSLNFNSPFLSANQWISNPVNRNLSNRSPVEGPTYKKRLETYFIGLVNLAAFRQLPMVLRKIMPDPARWGADSVTSGIFTFQLQTQEYSNWRVLRRGDWFAGFAGYFGSGSGVVSFYSRVAGLTLLQAAMDLAITLNVKWEDRQIFGRESKGLKQDLSPLMGRHSLASSTERLKIYLGKTGRPILVAIEQLWPEYSVEYLIRCQIGKGESFWVPAMPDGLLPFFWSPVPGQYEPGHAHFVPAEFDSRLDTFGSTFFTTVPGGNGNIHATDLAKFQGWTLHLELLPEELINAALIEAKVREARVKACTFSLIGEYGEHDVSQIVSLAEARGFSVGLTKLPKSTDALPIVDDVELAESEIDERPWLVRNLMKAASFGLLYAPPKHGKSWLAMHIAYLCAGGGRIGSWSADGGLNVLIIEGEMDKRDAQRNLRRVGKAYLKNNKGSVKHLSADAMDEEEINILDPKFQELLEPRLKGFDVIILDNLNCLTGEAEADTASKFVKLKRWAFEQKRKGRTVLGIDHTNQDGGVKGTQDKLRRAEFFVRLDGLEYDNDDRFSMNVTVTPRWYVPLRDKSFRVTFELSREVCRIVSSEAEKCYDPKEWEVMQETARVSFLRDHRGPKNEPTFVEIGAVLRISKTKANDYYRAIEDYDEEKKMAIKQLVEQIANGAIGRQLLSDFAVHYPDGGEPISDG